MGTVIVAGARTPMGKLQGALAALPAVELGGYAIRGALDRAGVSGDRVGYVAMGHVLQAGAGQLTARQAAVAAGIGMQVPAVTVNKVCLSGLEAVVQADRLIRLGEYEVVVAGGMESMSQAPHLLPGSRTGTKYGDTRLLDSMITDGLLDVYTDLVMGALTERANARFEVDRAAQDAWAARSHQLAAKAQADGVLGEEIVPVPVPAKRGTTVQVDEDEGIRPDSSAETLARLRPSFPDESGEGTITPASASQLSDGAAALLVMDEQTARDLGLQPLARIGSYATVAGPDSSLQLQPANAIRAATAKAGLTPEDLDLVEINEAFAAVALASVADLGVEQGKVNACGGAIALGHPLGMSGARLVLHLALALRRRGGGRAAAALCGGGGQGEALLLEVR